MDDALEALYRYDLGRNARRAAEAKALKNAESAYCYACYVLKGRWPEGESVIVADPCWAYYYANNVIKGRWPEAEAVIASDPTWAHSYAYHVLHDLDPSTWGERFRAVHDLHPSLNRRNHASS